MFQVMSSALERFRRSAFSLVFHSRSRNPCSTVTEFRRVPKIRHGLALFHKRTRGTGYDLAFFKVNFFGLPDCFWHIRCQCSVYSDEKGLVYMKIATNLVGSFLSSVSTLLFRLWLSGTEQAVVSIAMSLGMIVLRPAPA